MSVRFAGISATTQPFFLPPAQYTVTYDATWGGGNATLERRSDAGQWGQALAPFTANGTQKADLGGTYRLAIAGGAASVNAGFVALTLY